MVEIVSLPEKQTNFFIDINTATWVEWMQVPEVGEKLAKAIVQDRQQVGPYQSIDQLTRVKGIGEKTLKRMRPHLKLVQQQLK